MCAVPAVHTKKSKISDGCLAVQKRAGHVSETNAEDKEQTEARMPEIESAAEQE